MQLSPDWSKLSLPSFKGDSYRARLTADQTTNSSLAVVLADLRDLESGFSPLPQQESRGAGELAHNYSLNTPFVNAGVGYYADSIMNQTRNEAKQTISSQLEGSMQNDILEQVEERFYFRTSHVFWHLLAALGGLALLGGVLVFLWGLTPSLKPGVSEPQWPEPIAVAADEIKQELQPASTPPPSELANRVSPAARAANGARSQPADSLTLAYQVSLDSLKALLPANKFPWQSRGHWERNWYRNRWVVDVVGIQEQLDAAFERTGAHSPVAKKQVINGLTTLLAAFPLDSRYAVFRGCIDCCKNDVATAAHNLSLLHAALPLFSDNQVRMTDVLATFIKKNPRDGQRFVSYSSGLLPGFASEARESVTQVLVESYYSFFNDISKQQEATNLFVPMIGDFEPVDQANALAKYYEMFVSRNATRQQQIARMQESYQAELNQAKIVVAEKKASKTGWRSLGWKLIAGSLAAVAFLALFLVLLSIQRNLKMLREMAVAASK